MLSITFFFLYLVVTIAHAEPTIVGVFGDIHGRVETATNVLQEMKKKKVTHIIGTGDYIESGGEKELDSILKLIGKITHVPKDQTFFVPGNWDEKKATKYGSNIVLEKYGSLISADYLRPGYLTVAGKKIMVSHLAQHPVPDAMLPSGIFIGPLEEEMMKMQLYPSADTDLEIFAHTHIAGYYFDERSKKLVINVGTLHEQRKSPEEPLAYALYYPEKNRVDFFRVGQVKPIESVSTILTSYQKLQCAVLLRHLFSGL